jgi:ATP-dependent Lhr-like helicase
LARGAVFSSAFTSPLEGRPAHDALRELMTRGLVHADSFTPVRQWLERAKAEKFTMRQKVNARIQTLNAGRWDISRNVKKLSLKESINRAFDVYVILCKETAKEMQLPWAECLEILRVMEYTGDVRRGYFAEGLSGAQYVRADDFGVTAAALESPESSLRWLPANDPCQPWGQILRHLPGRVFMLIQGTVAAIYAGLPIAVFERGGATLRVFDENNEHIETALNQFVKDYAARRCYPAEKRITVKSYPPWTEGAFVNAGFARVMDDFVLRREYT